MLEILAPTWYQILTEKWKKLRKYERESMYVQLKSFDKCLIGEIYNWTDDYTRVGSRYCEECEWFSFSCTYLINGPDYILDMDLLYFKDAQFAAHWNESHRKPQQAKAIEVSTST